MQSTIMSQVEEAVTEHWGERCETRDEACPTCIAWDQFDALAALKPHPWSDRLAQVDKRTVLESAILELHAQVEALGAHPLLTDASTHLFYAVCALGAWEDAGWPGATEKPDA